MQIVAGDDDKRPFFHGQRDGDRHRGAIAFGVGSVQQCHAPEILFSYFHYDRQKIAHGPILAHGKESLCKESVHRIVAVAQHHGVMRVGCHAPHAEENQRLQAAGIRIGVPEQAHVIVVISPTAGGAAGAVGCQPCFFRMYPVNQIPDRLFVEVYVGDGGEQSLNHQLPGLRAWLGVSVYGTGQTDQCTGQFILKRCHIGGLAAYPGFPGTAAASGCLLTLKTKHLMIHFEILAFFFSPGYFHQWKGSPLARE